MGKPIDDSPPLLSTSSSSSSNGSTSCPGSPSSLKPKSTPRSHGHLRTVLAVTVAGVLFVMGQMYIATTIAGTRPLPARSARGARYNVRLSFLFDYSGATEWAGCAATIASRLKDLGDAGRLWRRHSYVGSNFETPLPGARATLNSWSKWFDNGAEAEANEIDDRYRCKCQEPEVYAPDKRPDLTAIVHSHDRAKDVVDIAVQLRAIDEVIVADAGSKDGSLYAWQRVLARDGDFVVRGNGNGNGNGEDVLDKAVRMAGGQTLAFVNAARADGGAWIKNARRLLEAYPELGVVGGAVSFRGDRAMNGASEMDFEGLRCWKTNLTFAFVDCTVAAADGPLLVRREVLQRARGSTMYPKAHPNDCSLSYAAWASGFSVGAMYIDGEAKRSGKARKEEGEGDRRSRDIMVEKEDERAADAAELELKTRFPIDWIRAVVADANNDLVGNV